MARADYAAILDRHSGKGEALAGGAMQPVLERVAGGGVCQGRALVEAAMMHGNRWPALYGGYLFDLADRIARIAVEATAGEKAHARPLSLEMHFLRAIRRGDVPTPAGLRVAWRATAAPARSGSAAVVVEIGDEGALFAYALATLTVSRDTTVQSEPPSKIVLPCHDADWTAGSVRGRCLEAPGSFAAIADTLVAKAMATVRGDAGPQDADEHFLVRTLSYQWLQPVDDGLATYEARVVQRGRRMALAVGELALAGEPVGRAAGTVVIQHVSR